MQEIITIPNIDKICRLFMKTRPKNACVKSYDQQSVGVVEYEFWKLTKEENYANILHSESQDATANNLQTYSDEECNQLLNQIDINVLDKIEKKKEAGLESIRLKIQQPMLRKKIN